MAEHMTRQEAEARMEAAELEVLESVGSLSARTKLRSQAAELGHLRSERDKLRTEVERLQEGLRAILREHHEQQYVHYRACAVCSPADNRWPCTTVLEARAALEGKE